MDRREWTLKRVVAAALIFFLGFVCGQSSVERADVNGDGHVDVVDVQLVVNTILEGRP